MTLSRLRTNTALTVIAAALLMAAPVAAEQPEAVVAGDLARNHVIPASTALAEAAGRLDDSLATGCAELASARAAYHAAMDAWMGLQHVNFGPITYLQRDSRLYFWPDKTGAMSKQLARALKAADPALLEPETLARGSVALQGLPVLERLLFPAKPPAGDPAYRCALTRAVAGSIATIARGLLADWRDGDRPYAILIEQADQDDALFESSLEVVGLFLRSLDQGLLVVDELRLGRPLGDGGSRPRPRRAESWRSERSGRNVKLVLKALADMAAPAGGGGFAGLLEAYGEAALAGALRQRVSAVLAAAGALGDSLFDAVEDAGRRPVVEALRAEVRETRALVTAEIAPALGVTIGFNSLDGD